MNIFVDESGTFPVTPKPGSWCVVAAYVSPERDRKNLEGAVLTLRRSVGRLKEAKLNHLDESQYFYFLKKLGDLNGTLYASATDMSLNVDLAGHRQRQAALIRGQVSRMKYEEGRRWVVQLANGIDALPVNLYAQLVFQTRLFFEVIGRGTMYYVQRMPQSLREFRWRVDRKDVHVTEYETLFRRLAPALIESMSARHPFNFLAFADYSAMAQYEFADGEVPHRLAGGQQLDRSPVFDLGKMIGGNFEFVDSQEVIGVQVADLLASGLRRLLKGEFLDNFAAAKLLGGLTVQAEKESFPLTLLLAGPESLAVEGAAYQRLKVLGKSRRPMMPPIS